MNTKCFNAAQLLAGSERGLEALEGLQQLLYQRGAISLDAQGQQAVRTLLDEAWGAHAGTAREAMSFALLRPRAT